MSRRGRPTAWLRLFAAASTLIALAACAPTPGRADQSTVLRVLGDSALGDLPQSLVNAYEARSRAGSVIYTPAVRSQILDALKSNATDAAFLLSPPDDRSFFHTPIGYEALAVVTSPDLSVGDISEANLGAIFSGRKANWSDVGGPDLPIQPVVPFVGRSERAAFEALIMHGQSIGSSALVASGEAQLLVIVKSDKGRVGFMAVNQVQPGIRALTVNGRGFPGASVPDSAYPLMASVAFASGAEPQAEAKSFLDWILSEDGQRIVAFYAMRLN